MTYMRDDYKMHGPLTKIEIELEKPVFQTLLEMEKFSKFSRSELINTAFKRFITAHKDFLPPDQEGAA